MDMETPVTPKLIIAAQTMSVPPVMCAGLQTIVNRAIPAQAVLTPVRLPTRVLVVEIHAPVTIIAISILVLEVINAAVTLVAYRMGVI